MKKYRGIFIILGCCIFVVLISGTFLTSHAAFSKANSKTLLFNGTSSGTLANWLINSAPKSGTDAVSNSPWILTSDRTGEWRYAGKNPDNYLSFNGELWRIIGVMPNMTYCTGEYGSATECNTTATGSLVKIIRNQVISSSTLSWDYKQTGVGSCTSVNGSNDWSDSQLMLMLNGANYRKTGYDVNGTKLHTSYTINDWMIADSNGHNFYEASNIYIYKLGTTVITPSPATTGSYTPTQGSIYKEIVRSATGKIATVKWDLYGTNSFATAAEGSPAAFYNKERNINGLGAVYPGATPENRPVYWYGKIGLMYPSDFGYATNGGSTYNRSTCLGYQMDGWDSGSYKTDCAGNSYLWYNNITSTAPGTSGTNQWTLSPYSGNTSAVFYIYYTGNVRSGTAFYSCGVRPVLYLKADTMFGGSGSGTYDDPYTIDPKPLWSPWPVLEMVNPNPEDGQYLGKDYNNKTYACLKISNHNVCLSQPYTQYGLTDHTVNTTFTAAQEEGAKAALEIVFGASGITDYSCNYSGSFIRCTSDHYYCIIQSGGTVACGDSSVQTGIECKVKLDGTSCCGLC